MLVLKSTNDFVKKHYLNSKVIARGLNSVVLNNNIKLNRVYHNNLNISFPDRVSEAFVNTYGNGNQKSLCSLEYLERLQSMENNLYGTRFDSGVIEVDGIIVGTVGPEGVLSKSNLGYKQITIDSIENITELMNILDVILVSLGVLEEKRISYKPVSIYEGENKPVMNFIYSKKNNLDIRFANLGGEDFKFDENFDAKTMYQDYMLLLKRLIAKFETSFPDVMMMLSEINYQNINNYRDALKVTEEVKKLVK